MVRDVLIVGAGPSGLATAIAAKMASLDYAVVEKGALVNSIFNFPAHMVFFTTPELLEIGRLPLVTPYDKPTRLEALRYYRRVVDTYDLQIAFSEAVTGIEREADETFTVTTTPAGAGRVCACAIGGPGDRLLRHSKSTERAREDLPHVSHYYNRRASLLPEARGHCRRQEFGGRGRRWNLSGRRTRDDRPSAAALGTRLSTGSGRMSRTGLRKAQWQRVSRRALRRSRRHRSLSRTPRGSATPLRPTAFSC